MKILHTSDWHLGHILYNNERAEEHNAFLRQLADIVQEEQPDAMIVSGDIYHTSSPSASAQRMYTEAMLDIHGRCPEMTIVVTAGNHDSSSRLEINSSLWDFFGLKVVGNIERHEDHVNLDKHIISVTDSKGKTKGYIIAIPHVYPQNFPILDITTPRENRMSAFFEALQKRVGSINTEGLPVVMSCHLAVTGADITGHDESVGGMEYYPLASMGEGYDYLALGHIHCPQTLRNSNGKARYSGSPIPVSFDENYPHSVSIVEVEHGRQPDIRTIEISNPVPCITLPAEPVAFDEALAELEKFPSDSKAYIRLNVLVKNYLTPDCNERASEATKGKLCRFCYIKTNRKNSTEDSAHGHLTIDEIRHKSPLEIAEMYYREEVGEDMDDELKEMMQSVIRHISEKENE